MVGLDVPGEEIALSSAIVHSARLHSVAGGVEVVSTGGHWEYALSIPVPPLPAPKDGQLLHLSMTSRFRGGAAALGLVAADGVHYLGETRVDPEDGSAQLMIAAERLPPHVRVVLRNTDCGAVDLIVQSLRVAWVDPPPPVALRDVTQRPFTPRVPAGRDVRVAAINTTEVCNLSCAMCHFNGPRATIRAHSLSPLQVARVLDQIPAGTQVLFSGTGDILMDPHALDYLRAATEKGLRPALLTNGQKLDPETIEAVLAAGVRFIRISVDSTRPEQYRKIRRGGELEVVLEACRILRERKASDIPDLRVEINCTLFRTTRPHMAEMAAFWRGRVDQVNFNAEYYDTFHFRDPFWVPPRRNDCDLQLYVMPSGRIAPCCAVAVVQHERDLNWLPHIDEVPLNKAYEILSDLYHDKASPLAALCRDCDWWILFSPADAEGVTPYLQVVDLTEPGA